MRRKSRHNKSTYIKFRCSQYEKKLLYVKAKRAGLSMSAYCRRAVMEDRIVERLTEEQLGAYKMLVQYHNNFKRIANMFRKRNPKLADEVAQLAREIKTHLYNFKK
ncbi:mobilization protein MbpA [Sinomicrobium sp. M5D2P17]